MTKKYEDTISVPNSEFVSTMERFLNNEAITKIDVTYYVSGGCNLKTYVGESVKKYYVYDKPANKFGRFSGEIGWLLSDRKDVTHTREETPDRITYIIDRIEDEPAPDAVTEETFNAPKSSASRQRYTPLVYSMTQEGRAKQSVLSVVMHEMEQTQVEEVSLVSRSLDEPYTSLHIVAHDDDNIRQTSEVIVDLNSSTTQEAVNYILDNEKYFTTKYSCDMTAVKDNDGNVTSLTLTRTPDVRKMTPKYRKLRLEGSIFINGSGGHWNLGDFLRNHLANKDVKSIDACKKENYYNVSVKLNSGACVEYHLSNKDFPDFVFYVEENFYDLMWEGFVPEIVINGSDGEKTKMVTISRSPSAGYDGGSLFTRNVPFFVRESLDDYQSYEIHLSVGGGVDKHGSVTLVDSVTNNKTSFEIKAPAEEVKRFITWFKAKAKDIEAQVGAKIECMDDEWGYYIKVRKNIRFSWEWYLRDGNITPEAIEFLTNAYRAGVGMVITGEKGSGKTCFASTLAENASADSRTAFIDTKAEVRVPGDTTPVIIIAGTSRSALNVAPKVTAERVIFDDPGADDGKAFLKNAAEKNLQLIMLKNGAVGEDYHWTDDAVPYPFNIEIQMGPLSTIQSIKQLVGPSIAEPSQVLWIREKGTLQKKKDPSRTMRRMIEAESKLSVNEWRKINNFTSTAESSKLVTISESEKREIRAALALLQSIVDRF